MLNPSFNRNIKGIIKKLNFPMYCVVLDKRYVCTCGDENNQPDAGCPKCLGTGYRIKIRKVVAAMEPETESSRTKGVARTTTNDYYFDADTTPPDVPNIDNLIVRDDEVDILMYPRKYRSDSNKIVYYYCASAPKRTHVKEFLKNFWKLVGRK